MKVSRTLLVLLVVAAAAFGWVYGPSMITRVAYAVERGQVQAAREGLVELSKQDTISPLIREVSRVVSPAVVEVRVAKLIEQPDMSDFFRRFFRDEGFGSPEMAPQQRRVFGLGSGVIVDGTNGYVITNYHVVGGADRVKVVLADGRELDNEWIRTDPQTDLAIIKLKNTQDLIEAPLGDSSQMQVGDMVLAIGAPSGLAQTVTMGIISATGRVTGATKIAGQYQDYIQTDAAINRGNSGGPLVNMRGEVIGINNMIISSSGGFQGIGFAIPSNMVRNIMGQLIEEGKVTRGFLGVSFQPEVDADLARSFGLSSTRGALVTSVVEDSPAAQAGVEVSDFIVAVDDQEVASGNDLRNIIAARQPGQTVTLTVVRNGERRELKVTLAQQPPDMVVNGEEAPGGIARGEGRYGIATRTLTQELSQRFGYRSQQRGAIVTNVAPDSNAAEQGLRPGMLITQAQGAPIETSEDLDNVLRSSQEGVRVLVTTPQGGQRFIFLRPSSGVNNR
jgi:serine protease Do